jgi:hypothetical protein
MIRFPSALLAAVVAAAPALGAQPARPDGAFVILLGRDTISLERFTRTSEGINHEQVLRSPQATLRHTHIGLAAGDRIGELFVMLHEIGGALDAPLIASTKLTVAGSGDSASIVATRGDSTSPARTVPVEREMIPMISSAFLPYEMASMRLRARKADSIQVTFLNAGGQTLPVTVTRIGGDSVRLTNPFYRFRAKVDGQGRILGLAGEVGTPFQATVVRVPDVDIDGTAKAWKAADARAGAAGQLSPADSVRATVGGASIAVNYSRPAKRGRTIFGVTVPFGEVWRTGANAATTFTTSRDLDFGGTVVPAGTYTLFSIPAQSGATLIVSRRTTGENGQPLWGTEYKDDMDLARIPMTVRTLSSPVEQLEIAVEPQGNGGALLVRWDAREMRAPFTVR